MASADTPSGLIPEGPSGAQRRPWLFLLTSAAAYGLVLLAAEALAHHWVLKGYPRLAALPVPRQLALVHADLTADLVYRGALLSLPLLLAVLLTRWRRPDPLAELGVTGRGLWHDLAPSFSHGVILQLLVAAALGALSGAMGGPRPVECLDAVLLTFFAACQLRGRLGCLLLVCACFCYGLGLTVVPMGHLHGRLRRGFGPAAALAMAAVFALPVFADSYVSPLAVLNVALLGLVLERHRTRAGNLWAPIGFLAGWTLLGRFSGLCDQGIAEFHAPFTRALPTFVSGGLYGAEGGLAATLVLSAWLAALLLPSRPKRLGTRVEGTPEKDEAIRPEGFEPPTP